jgi:hypothetical protein
MNDSYHGRGRPFRDQRADAAAQGSESATPAAELSREAVRLLLALDATRSVRTLPTQYPHVLNRLARLWSAPQEAQRCLDELLLSSRSGRQGFPPAVIAELMLLHGRNSKRLPLGKQDIWSETMFR